MKAKYFIFILLTLYASITVSAETWTDANGTEWYFYTNGSNATIACRGTDNDGYYIPSISVTIPEELSIPSTVYVGETPYTVTSIEDYVFNWCSGLTSITIPESVTSIGNGAFSYCSGLTSITIPESVTSIGENAFYGCSSLTSITIPNSVTSIGYSAFHGCYFLAESFINLSTLTSSNNWGAELCDELTNDGLFIKDGIVVKYTGTSTTITIPEYVTSIGDGAFSWCSCLTSITIPNGVTSIGNEAFYGCTGLTSITIPNSMTSIGYCAFAYCI